jgi:broad specificity phosphatase PhoE
VPLYLVRHAKAGDREDWQGDDRLRPLSKPGRRQAEALIGMVKDLPVDYVVSSPYLRCLQTVEPLAAQRGLPIETTEALAEGAGIRPIFELMRRFGDRPAVLCTHGDVVQEFVEHLAAEGVIRPRDADKLAKGSTWVIDHTNGTITAARYLDPPKI